MTGLDGLATLRRMVALDPQSRVIVLSSHPIIAPSEDRPDFMAMAIKLGATAVLPWRFGEADLLETLALARHEAPIPPRIASVDAAGLATLPPDGSLALA
ncbi:hypothetical protein SAMN05428963_10348 [Consotaella salsifontis]|uniref:Response regulatory domain-containing protein n=1 Tax=Consotaella salsifontis TaxID=1365950 RepID=A0A1T4NJ67_9HYPH|nr:hypothetical protein SAMN05428963_10348 [Consotaella salsifontis]